MKTNKKNRTPQQMRIRGLFALSIITVMLLVIFLPTKHEEIQHEQNQIENVMDKTLDSLLRNKGYDGYEILSTGSTEYWTVSECEELEDSLQFTKQCLNKFMELARQNNQSNYTELIRLKQKEYNELLNKWEHRDSTAQFIEYARKVKFKTGTDKNITHYCVQSYRPHIGQHKIQFVIDVSADSVNVK